MPSYRNKYNGKPWIARRKRDGIEFFLGYHATREEAIETEKAFEQQEMDDREQIKTSTRSDGTQRDRDRGDE